MQKKQLALDRIMREMKDREEKIERIHKRMAIKHCHGVDSEIDDSSSEEEAEPPVDPKKYNKLKQARHIARNVVSEWCRKFKEDSEADRMPNKDELKAIKQELEAYDRAEKEFCAYRIMMINQAKLPFDLVEFGVSQDLVGMSNIRQLMLESNFNSELIHQLQGDIDELRMELKATDKQGKME